LTKKPNRRIEEDKNISIFFGNPEQFDLSWHEHVWSLGMQQPWMKTV
jgi:hypothetical protein